MSWDFSLLDMGLRVMMEKLMLVLYIRNLEEDLFARRIYEEQIKHDWPGLAKEARIICEELNIEDVNITKEGKMIYRKIVLSACHQKN